MTMGRSVRRVEGPWARLLDAMKLLTLEPDQFRIAVDRIFDADANGLGGLSDELEVSQFDLDELIEVVRLREDCWR
jgi:RAD50-interacting protein 1